MNGTDNDFKVNMDGLPLVEEQKPEKVQVDFLPEDDAGFELYVGDFALQAEQEEHGLSEIASSDTIGLYFKEMARTPLLSAEEEVQLAMRMEAGLIAEQQLAEFPEHERRAEWQFLVQDGINAKDHLTRANTRLVVSVAKRFMSRGVPLLDLIQEGNLGLMKAVEKFDYHRGLRFSTYATWWIRQSISRSIADHGRIIRVPVHMSDSIRHLYHVKQELEQETGRKPSIEEIAEAMKCEPKKVQLMLRVSWRPLSLEQPAGNDDDAELGSFIANDREPNPSDSTDNKNLKERLERLLETLTPREALILCLRFGLKGGRPHTLEEVGEKFGLTRERIRQIQGRALRRLRHPRRSRQLRDYLR